MITIRKSDDRGKADYGWLKARYTFSFAKYYDPNFSGFGDLLVINQDEIAPGKGFGTHSHRDMEILTYVTEGTLEHVDSMGNKGFIRPGEIQYMSAGTGVTHSEFNHLQEASTKLLQIWIKPNQLAVPPNYDQISYLERLKPNELCLLASPNGKNESIKIHQDALIYTAKLNSDGDISYSLGKGRKAWLQLIRGEILVNNHIIQSGDGLMIIEEEVLKLESKQESEFLLFDLR